MRALAPPSAFEALDANHRLRYWTAKLADDDPHQHVAIAEIGSQVVGIGAVRRPSDPIFGSHAEIKNLYVMPDYQGQGMGTRILKDLAAHAEAAGYRSVALSVVKGNERAAGFYEALRAKKIGEFRDPGPIWRSDNVVYGWDEIDQLLS